MSGLSGQRPLCLLGRSVDGPFDVCLRVVAAEHVYAVDDVWNDALVEVAAGQIEVEYADRQRRRFRAGDVLWLDRSWCRALRSCGPSAVLVTLRRRPR